MSTTAEVLLGIIAASVAIMALIQIGAIVAGLRLARRVDRLTTQLEEDVKPLIDNITSMSRDAAKTTTLAVGQVERVDATMREVLSRLDSTVSTAHHLITGPARRGVAVVAGVRAAVGAFHSLREASRRRSAVRHTHQDNEESLFIG